MAVMLFWNRVYQNPLNFRTNGTIKSDGCYVSKGTDNDDIMVLTVLVIASTVVSLIIRTRSPDMTIHMYGSEIGYPFYLWLALVKHDQFKLENSFKFPVALDPSNHIVGYTSQYVPIIMPLYSHYILAV